MKAPLNWRMILWVLTGSLILSVFLQSPPQGPFLEQLSFDIAATFQPSQTFTNIIIVELDEKSHRELGQIYRRWDRSLHASLLDRLTQDAVDRVVYDIAFLETGSPAEDAAFAGALRRNGKAVLTAVSQSRSGNHFVGSEILRPISVFLRAVDGRCGVSAIPTSYGRTAREHLSEPDSIESLPWIAATMTLGPQGLPPAQARAERRWLRYYGPPGSVFRQIGFVDALKQPPGFFRGKTVFIGGSPWTKLPGEQVDLFRTPYSLWEDREVAGVEVVATEYLNLIRKDWIKPPKATVQFALSALLGIALILCSIQANSGRMFMGLAWVVVVFIGLAAPLAMRNGFFYDWLGLSVQWAGTTLLLGWGLGLFAPSRTSLTSSSLRPHAPETQNTETAADEATGTAPYDERSAIPDYTLIRKIGQGAYGEVWLASNVLGDHVAIKIIFQDRFRDARPYEREFKGLKHFAPISRSSQDFLQILHVGRDDRRGRFYYVMERADDAQSGRSMPLDPLSYSPRTLASDLDSKERLPIRDCIALGLQLARGLQTLHSQGLVHRDIKPDNVVYVNGTPKLADIGLITEVASTLQAVSYLGTPGYIAPEGPGHTSADLYSLGKVLYAAYTGLGAQAFPSFPPGTSSATPEDIVIRFQEILVAACAPTRAARYPSLDRFIAELKQVDETLEQRGIA